jgi:hypothetical protein
MILDGEFYLNPCPSLACYILEKGCIFWLESGGILKGAARVGILRQALSAGYSPFISRAFKRGGMTEVSLFPLFQRWKLKKGRLRGRAVLLRLRGV